MPIIAPRPGQGTGDFKPAPAGSHVAVCVGVVDLGTHDGEYDGKPTVKRKVLLRFEVDPDDGAMEDGRPYLVSRTFNLSMHENSDLRKLLHTWVGPISDAMAEAFDVASVLGRPALLTIVHNPDRKDPTRIWANIEGAAPLPRRLAAFTPVNPLIEYSTDTGPPPEEIPERIRATILQSHEFRGSAPAGAVPPAARRGPAGPFDTGAQLADWAARASAPDMDVLGYLENFGGIRRFPASMAQWDAGQVARAYADATAWMRELDPKAPAEDPIPY